MLNCYKRFSTAPGVSGMEKMIIELEATLTKKLEAKLMKHYQMNMLKISGFFLVSIFVLVCFIIAR